MKQDPPPSISSNEKVDQIAKLFPTAVIECHDSDGNSIRMIDFNLLRQELSGHIVDTPQERYQLNWPGKRASLYAANTPIEKRLYPIHSESVDFNTTQNLFIEGDNLDALKLLSQSYQGKVKLIYIDPPYNTGKNFIYNDDFSETKDQYLIRSGQIDDAGVKTVANIECDGRMHSDWLSIMYSRLTLARLLLTQDGVLCMSIDDNEVHNLRKIAEEVFGESNFVAQVAVQVNPRGRHLDKFVAKTHESLLVFVRDATGSAVSRIEKSKQMVKKYPHSDDNGLFRLMPLRNANRSFNPKTRPNLYYPVFISPEDGQVSIEEDESHTIAIWPDAPDGRRTCWTWGKDKVNRDKSLLIAKQLERSGEWRVYRKNYLCDENGKISKTLARTIWTESQFSTSQGTKAIKELFGARLMDFPKSPDLLARILEIGCSPDGLVIDFFAGSCTTAHAVMNANAMDGGTRRFIMVNTATPCPPSTPAFNAGFSTVSSFGAERIRRAGKDISTKTNRDIDIGFRYLRIGEDDAPNPD